MHLVTTRAQDVTECTQMKSPDPASLQNLNDIVIPASVDWWPLATGWYVVIGVLMIILAWVSYRSLRRWFDNRYRRAALHELQLLAQGIQNDANHDANLRQIPVLLKRTALSAYPRDRVASLSGKDWHDFLNSTLKTPVFSESTTAVLDELSYTSGDLSSVDVQAEEDLLGASKKWLQYHVAQSSKTGRKT
jgi:hypothetical protein